MSEQEIRGRIEKLEAALGDFTLLTGLKIDSLVSDLDSAANDLTFRAETNITRVETRIIPLINVITLSATYHLDRAYFLASPGLMAILATILTVVNTVVRIVRIIMNSQLARLVLTIHKILYATWNKYKSVINAMLKNVSDVSKAIGLGADGLTHLMNAFESSVGLIAGLKGDDWQGFQSDFYAEVEKAIAEVSVKANALAKDPATWIRDIFLVGQESEYFKGKLWWEEAGAWVTEAVSRSEEALKGLSTVIKELQMFGESLPEFIRDNIPQSIWYSLSKADTAINNRILPQLAHFTRKIDEINNMLNAYTGKMKKLTDDLAHPGSILLGVDDLPDYARDSELYMIDDVTSRQFQESADWERQGLSSTIEEFDKIEEAMSVPTPEPGFLSIEDPQRRAATGIVEEPRETWFVGDY